MAAEDLPRISGFKYMSDCTSINLVFALVLVVEAMHLLRTASTVHACRLVVSILLICESMVLSLCSVK